jgi:S1-C subfamily serine protease
MPRISTLRLAIPTIVALVLSVPAMAGEKLGLEGRFLDAQTIAALFNVDVPGGGVLVEHVREGSPAARAGLRGGEVAAKIQGEDLVLGGDLIIQLEVHHVCAGVCLQSAPTELERFSWVGATYLRRGKIERAVIQLDDAVVEPVEEPAPTVAFP